jgi:hypothetical protein
MKGDETTAAAQMQSAAEAWPTNPKLKEATEMAGKASDVQNQALIDFDRLLSQKNYRQIFADQTRYAVAIQGDAQRMDQFKQIMTNMGQVTLALTGAKQAASKGNVYMAYEEVEKLYRQFPEDQEVSSLRSDLAIQAADFVSALHTGDKFEKDGQTGSSLAWYAKAKKLYPMSDMALDGMKRMMGKVKPGASSAPAPAINGTNSSSGVNPISTTSAPAPTAPTQQVQPAAPPSTPGLQIQGSGGASGPSPAGNVIQTR